MVRAIWSEARDDPAKAGLGTTVVCAIVDPGPDGARAWLANVGDSPAFLVSPDGARQVTRDHSWLAEQVAAGELRPEDVASHPYHSILTRCLGTEQTVQVDLPDEALLLCSDGLTAHVGAEESTPLKGRPGPPRLRPVRGRHERDRRRGLPAWS